MLTETHAPDVRLSAVNSFQVTIHLVSVYQVFSLGGILKVPISMRTVRPFCFIFAIRAVRAFVLNQESINLRIDSRL